VDRERDKEKRKWRRARKSYERRRLRDANGRLLATFLSSTVRGEAYIHDSGVPTGVLAEAVSTERRQWEEHRMGREREVELKAWVWHPCWHWVHRKGKELRNEAMKRGE
jgi:hypothetical protein